MRNLPLHINHIKPCKVASANLCVNETHTFIWEWNIRILFVKKVCCSCQLVTSTLNVLASYWISSHMLNVPQSKCVSTFKMKCFIWVWSISECYTGRMEFIKFWLPDTILEHVRDILDVNPASIGYGSVLPPWCILFTFLLMSLFLLLKEFFGTVQHRHQLSAVCVNMNHAHKYTYIDL